ncbi:peptidase family M49-domain-containing protein [Aspergillus californicus]
MATTESSYYPPPGTTVNQLVIKPIFDALEPREKIRSFSCAAYNGSRIIMRQVSPESLDIFDFIIKLYHACGGEWDIRVARRAIKKEDLTSFLEYAAVFLFNLGNFYGEGDQMFVPNLSVETLRRIADISPATKARLEQIIDPLLSIPPFSLGYPRDRTQSAYYLGAEPISNDEINRISEEVLGIFGYTDDSVIIADDLLYATYLNISVDGFQALEHYNFHSKTWGQVHHQAHLSIFKYLLQSGSGVIRVTHEPTTPTLTVHIDRTKSYSHGKPALADYFCRLHIWRCTADVTACEEYYEPLCAVEGVHEEWRQIVCFKPRPRWKFVQPNTVVRGDDVQVKLYEATNEKIIKSWVERGV